MKGRKIKTLLIMSVTLLFFNNILVAADEKKVSYEISYPDETIVLNEITENEAEPQEILEARQKEEEFLEKEMQKLLENEREFQENLEKEIQEFIEIQKKESETIENTNISSERINASKALLSSTFVNTNIINGDVIIDAPLEITDTSIYYTGNVTITSYVNISNSNIYISGDLIIDAYVCLFDGSNITVEGDIRIQKENGSDYGKTDGYLYMRESSCLTVYGDYYTQSSALNFISPINDNIIRQIYLYGNFYQLGEDCYFRNQGVKIIFAGNKEQHVYFESNDVKSRILGNIRIEEESDIIFDIPIGKLIIDEELLVINGDLQVNYIEHIQGKLLINGNLTFVSNPGESSRNCSNVEVTGDLIVNGGNFYNNGNLYLHKDAIIHPSSTLMTSFLDSTVIKVHEVSKLTIEGNVYVEENGSLSVFGSTLILNSDLSLGTKAYLLTDDFSKVQLSGIGRQKVTYSYFTPIFRNLYINKPPTSYIFDRGGNGPYYLNCIPCDLKYICTDKNHSYESLYCRECHYNYSNPLTYYNLYLGTIEEIENQNKPEEKSTQEYKPRHYGTEGVHSPTGNFSFTHTDMIISTVLGSIPVARTYNSLSADKLSTVGKGFTLNLSMHIELNEESPGILNIVMPDGSVQRFKQEGELYESLDSRSMLTKQDELYYLNTIDKMEYAFSSSGSLHYMKDNKGNQVNITTGADGGITSMSDSSGMKVTFNYNNGLLSSVYDHASGKSASYIHDNGKLVRVNNAYNYSNIYEYNSGSEICYIKDSSGNVQASLTYYWEDLENGKVNTYKDSSNVTLMYYYHPEKNQTVIVNANGGEIKESYDETFAVTSREYNSKIEKVEYTLVDGLNKYNEIQYIKDMQENEFSYERDEKGRITRIIYPDKAQEVFGYDSDNNIVNYKNTSSVTTWNKGIEGITEKVVYVLDGTSIPPQIKNLTVQR